jgi:hypothetical protein
MQLTDVADALEDCTRAQNNIRAKQEIIRGLFLKCGNDAGAIEMLLRVLLPGEDRAHVYGFKTRRMLRLFADAIDSADGKLLLQNWRPKAACSGPSQQLGAYPEFAIAHACCCSSGAPQQFSVAQLLNVCDKLTDAYTAAHGSYARLHALQSQILRADLLANDLPFAAWVLIARMLLRCVTMSVGPATVLAALPNSNGFSNLFFERRHDLKSVAAAAAAASQQAASQQAVSQQGVVCGTPFVPMTCDAMRSPYLLKWLFSREESLNKQLTPIDGRLIIVTSASGVERWFVPLSTRAPQSSRFLDINIPQMLQTKNKARRQHIEMLRMFKKARFINAAVGLIIHYTLAMEEDDKTCIMLLRDTTDAIDDGAELVDASVISPPAAAAQSKKLDRLLLDANNDKVVHEGGYALKMAIATRRNPPRRRRVVVPAPQALPREAARKSERQQKRQVQLNDRSLPRAADEDMNEDEDKNEDRKGIIVQTKYDGDRIQAHVAARGARGVKLFTRRGFDVTEMYSDIADALMIEYEGVVPCVLDGELIVVDKSDYTKPLPWSNEKWRHNHRNAEGVADSPLVLDIDNADQGAVICVEHDESTLSRNWDESEHSDCISFIPYASKASLANEARGRIAANTMLQFVVFDVLMWRGGDTMSLPYADRLATLMKMKKKGGSKAVIVIPDGNKRVRNAKELETIVRTLVEEGHEGCVLKDPAASYHCKRSRCIQKVKPRGPDVNACVVGVGFSLTSNPRRWGLLTAIKLEDAFVSYCRTEVLEGDSLYKAFQHVHASKSNVCVEDILAFQRSGELSHTTAKKVVFTAVGTKMVQVEWPKPSQAEASQAEASRSEASQAEACTLMLLPDAMEDIQWLVNPFEVKFSLSLRGDLRPIEHPFKYKQATKMCVPRHPVGRIEFNPSAADWDTPATVQNKFDEAQKVETCIETWTLRRLAGIRALPADRQRMEEFGRIVTAWAGDQKEMWPQTPPGAVSSFETLSAAMETAMAKASASSASAASTKLIQCALGPLTLDERKALAGLPTLSQWHSFDAQGASGLEMEDEAYDDECHDEAALRRRLLELENNPPHAPILYSTVPLLRERPLFQA